jgi:hypothetical protein
MVFTNAWAIEQIGDHAGNTFQTSQYAVHYASSGAACRRGYDDYFEKDLDYLSALKDRRAGITALMAYFVNHDTVEAKNNLISRQCLDHAMDNVTAGSSLAKNRMSDGHRLNRFIRCGQNDRIFDDQDEPCQTDHYKNIVHNSFEVATACLKGFVSDSDNPQIQNAWVEAYFKMLATESGLHINTVSHAGAISIAQVQPVYIQDFRERALPDLRKYIQNKSDKDCKILLSFLSDKHIDALLNKNRVNACTNIDVKNGQPYLNLIIGFANLKSYREDTIEQVLSDSTYQELFSKFSPKELLNLRIKMTQWSYNLGNGGLKDLLKRTLDGYIEGKHKVGSVEELVRNMSGGSDKRTFLSDLDSRYKIVLNGRRSCRTDVR